MTQKSAHIVESLLLLKSLKLPAGQQVGESHEIFFFFNGKKLKHLPEHSSADCTASVQLGHARCWHYLV